MFNEYCSVTPGRLKVSGIQKQLHQTWALVSKLVEKKVGNWIREGLQERHCGMVKNTTWDVESEDLVLVLLLIHTWPWASLTTFI